MRPKQGVLSKIQNFKVTPWGCNITVQLDGLQVALRDYIGRRESDSLTFSYLFKELVQQLDNVCHDRRVQNRYRGCYKSPHGCQCA